MTIHVLSEVFDAVENLQMVHASRWAIPEFVSLAVNLTPAVTTDRL